MSPHVGATGFEPKEKQCQFIFSPTQKYELTLIFVVAAAACRREALW
jgi:hypothetical protein